MAINQGRRLDTRRWDGRKEGKEEREREEEKESKIASESERGRVKAGDHFGCGWRSQLVTAVCRRSCDISITAGGGEGHYLTFRLGIL